jgi:hypothetical protein
MSCFDIIAMSYTIYMVTCNSTTHATCPLALIAYNYNELQMSSATQKLNCKVCCKTPIFLIVLLFGSLHWHIGFFFHSYASFLLMHNYSFIDVICYMHHFSNCMIVEILIFLKKCFIDVFSCFHCIVSYDMLEVLMI